jgi:hypothetical protein
VVPATQEAVYRRISVKAQAVYRRISDKNETLPEKYLKQKKGWRWHGSNHQYK